MERFVCIPSIKIHYISSFLSEKLKFVIGMGQGFSDAKDQLIHPLKELSEELQCKPFPCPEGLRFRLSDGRDIGYSEYVHPGDASAKASDLDVVLL
jgi:hypothetical protein